MTDIPKQRTYSQNRSLWLFMTMLAEELNNAGLDMRKVLKPTYNIPWTKESVHDHLWLPIQKAMYGTESTTFLHKQGQIDKIHTVITRELGEKFGLDYIPFPVDPIKQEELLKTTYRQDYKKLNM
jgi:hypothetical protein